MSLSVLPIFLVEGQITTANSEYAANHALLVSPEEQSASKATAAIIGAGNLWNSDQFAHYPDLRVISRLGAGYDNVDLADAKSANITVCNAPDAPTISTAEYAIALILAVAKELPIQQDRARNGLPRQHFSDTLELQDSTLGLIGFGRIARRVATVSHSLGMNVIATDPALDSSPIPQVEIVTLDELLQRSTIVSLHAPANPSTYQMISKEALSKMRKGSYLINCARGSLVDHSALINAVDTGHLAGAGLDVTEPEPLPVGHPLLNHSNIIVTPHVASSTSAGRLRLFEHAFDNALAVLEGRPATLVTSPQKL